MPDVTTTDDLNWWIRQRYRELGLETSDHPTITVQRSKLERPKYAEGDEHFRIDVRPRNGYNTIIRRGDILGCDTGIIYYGAGFDLGGDELIEPAPLQPKGGYPIHANTTYAMELHTWTSVPEWGGQDVRMKMEQNVAMTENGLIFLGGRQTEWYVIK